MVTWRALFLGLICLGLWGCQDPPQLITAAPPGTELPPPLPDSEKEPAEALGEQSKAIQASAATAKTAAKTTEPPIAPALPTAIGETKSTVGGIKYQTLKEGTGPECKTGQAVKVHYTGTLENGDVFDSSRRRKEPFPFTLGAKNVIAGWEEGVLGMKVGERRKLTIPPEAAYGPQGHGQIPPNATLTFDVELVEAK